jgi:NitT/TauT family transport system permease protein
VKRAVIALLDVATVALVLLWWQRVSVSQALAISRPSAVGPALKDWVTNPYLRSSIYVTLEEAAVGLLLALAVAVVLAALLTASKPVAEFCEPFVTVLNAVPKQALAPLFLVVFGIGFSAKVYFIVASVFFIPFFSMFRALTSIDPVYGENLRALGGGRLWTVLDVKIPAIIGTTVASLRVTVAFALTGAIISELVVSQQGIGYQIAQAQNSLQPEMLVSGVLVVVVLALVMDLLLRLVERRFSAWRLT